MQFPKIYKKIDRCSVYSNTIKETKMQFFYTSEEVADKTWKNE